MHDLSRYFRETVGRQCVQPGCELRLQKADEEADICRKCGHRLAPKNVVNWRVAAPALAVLVLLLAGTTYLTLGVLERRAAAREQELLARATARFNTALRGVTAADVDGVAGDVQAEFGLSDEQKQRLLDSSQERIDSLPRELTPDAEERLERLFRALYQDEKLSTEERRSLERFAREEKLVAASVRTVEDRLRPRIEAAHRSLARGSSLARQGQYQEAREELMRATESDPGDAFAWTHLGAVHALLGESGEARSCYDKALRLDPENWLAHYNLGLLAERGGDRDGALRHLENALDHLGAGAARERQAVIENLLQEPSLAELRKDSRFSRLLATGG